MNEPDQSASIEYNIKYTPRLVLSILGPYVLGKIKEQIKAVLPISLFLLVFQFLVFRLLNLENPLGIAVGMCSVVIGLAFIMDGLRIGVMPLGENIGSTLPLKARLWVIMLVACIIGTAATLAEPAVGTLRILGSRIDPGTAPLLFDYLNVRTEMLLLVLAVGVGLGVCNGLVRLIKGWSLKKTIFPGLILAFILTIIAALDKNASCILGLVWDAGCVATGTAAAPLLLALGVGIATALGKNKNGMTGFGIITFCSIWPVVTLLCMGLFHSWTGNFMTPAECEAFLISNAANNPVVAAGNDVFSLVGRNLVTTAKALLPLMLIMLFIQRAVLREKIRDVKPVMLGIVFALIGLLFFLIGVELGLNPLGDQVGHASIISFSNKGFESLVPDLPADGRYGSFWGKTVLLSFGFIVGYGASLAEPALAALGLTVEDVTAGAFKKRLVVQTVGIGVGIGIAIGLAKILNNWPAIVLIGVSYAVAVLLTLFSQEKFVNIGWDSGGVTTGAITSSVVIALGLGVAVATGAADGFLLIGMSAIWASNTVLAMGIMVTKTLPFNIVSWQPGKKLKMMRTTGKERGEKREIQ